MYYVAESRFQSVNREEREKKLAELAERIIREHIRKEQENETGCRVLQTFR